jgi:hypothetical protein
MFQRGVQRVSAARQSHRLTGVVSAMSRSCKGSLFFFFPKALYTMALSDMPHVVSTIFRGASFHEIHRLSRISCSFSYNACRLMRQRSYICPSSYVIVDIVSGALAVRRSPQEGG